MECIDKSEKFSIAKHIYFPTSSINIAISSFYKAKSKFHLYVYKRRCSFLTDSLLHLSRILRHAVQNKVSRYICKARRHVD